MDLFIIENSTFPIIAAAIHDGHHIRPDLMPYMNLTETERTREEDPYTGYLTTVADSRVITNISRFEVDLNRPREKAVYLRPEDAWGLKVWTAPLPPSYINHSLRLYDAFYREMDRLLQHTIKRCGHFAVLDIHSYNYRRGGQEAGSREVEDAGYQNKEAKNEEAENPEINIGTVYNNPKWQQLTDYFISALAGTIIHGRHPDVRENIKFKGGEFSRWINKNYGLQGCILSIEFKKTFMNELTGIVSIPHLRDMKKALTATLTGLKKQLALVNVS